MAVRFYLDEHMRRVVAEGLGERGIYVVMAVDVGMAGKDDDTEHLPYATKNDLIIVTFDRPFAGRVMLRSDHSGLICISEKFRNDIGGIIRLLVQFSNQHAMSDAAGRVFWLK